MNLTPVLPSKTSNYAAFDLPKIQKAVNHVAKIIKCPLPLAQWAAISIANASMHGLSDVWNPRGFREPSSLFIVQVAASGEGKSAVDAWFNQGGRKAESEERQRNAAALKVYEEELEVYEITRQALATGLKRAINDGGDIEAAEQALLAHKRKKPPRPKLFRPFLEYVTPEAWIKAMAEGLPVSSMMSSEAAALMRGRSFDTLEFYNQGWGGGPISVDTKRDGSLSLPWCRFAMGLMTQPDPLARLLEASGKKGKENGFFARVLVCDPGSTQGSRLVYESASSSEDCDAFCARTEELLIRTGEVVRQEGYSPEVLHFSPDASALFFEIHNDIESQICVGGRYESAGDHASKLSSNIARVAATLHFFEGFEGEISVETLRTAKVLCEDSSADYLKHFVPPPRLVRDAMALQKWIDDYRKQGHTTVPMNYARRHCPNALRSEGRFFLAVEVLLREGVVKKTIDGRGTTHLIISPSEFHPFMWAGLVIGGS